MLIIKKQNLQKAILLTLIFVFATAFAPMVGEDQRNYSVILFAVLAAPLIILMQLRVKNDLAWILISLGYATSVVLLKDNLESLTTLAYTFLLSMGYLAVAGGLQSGYIELRSVVRLLKWLIMLYAIVSILQLVASLADLPIPNLILSKGMWSYNSLAVEPSHAGRALAMTMLTYLLIVRKWGNRKGLADTLIKDIRVVGAFCVSVGLSGSATGLIGALFAILLSLAKRQIIIFAAILMLVWPMLTAIEVSSLQRALAFINALPIMDISTVVETDQSGAMRVMPLLIFLNKTSVFDISFWLGGGFGAISAYIEGDLVGAGDKVGAGFIPGYVMAFGVFGTVLFLYAFVFRFLERFTLPIFILWLILLSTSPWNSQLFWYGLMLLRIAYHFCNPQKIHPYKHPQTRTLHIDNFDRVGGGA